MGNNPADEPQAALRPIASLIGKSEKAQHKLEPGTWQHSRLQNNLKALRIASALIEKAKGVAGIFSQDDLKEALEAVVSMMNTTEKSRQKFATGTSQHTLLHNRLEALRTAKTLIQAALEKSSR